MCGIGAVFSHKRINSFPVILNSINESLHHRGPDGNGIWFDENFKIGFSHTRLSIIDLSSASSQPFTSADGRFVITFNGEIYNFIELRQLCVSKGSCFKSEGDTEVILELFRHFQNDVSKMLRGMWAFVIYDREDQSVYISRDPFGIKPLYYGFFKDVLLVSSEIKAFQKLDPYFLEIDEVSVDLFKNQRSYDRGNWTFFKHIKKFPGAHHLSFKLNKIPDRNNLAPSIYFKLQTTSHFDDESSATQNLKKIFLESVRLHMRSDVPVGFCLSGGIDSSSIVASAKIVSSEAVLKTFTTRFPSYQRIDESGWAKQVIDHTGAIPHFIEPDPKKFLEDLKHLIHIQDEPFGSVSIYSQYCIFRGISEKGVKVVLDGQGADEIFAGYHAFFPFYIKSLILEAKFIEAVKVKFILKAHYNFKISLFKVFGSVFKSLLRRVFSTKGNLPKLSLYYNLQGLSDTRVSRLEFLNQEVRSFEDFLKLMVFEANVPMLLRFEDRNSMAFSVESRVPFLINELVEFSLSLRSCLKMKNGVTKYILRQAMKGIVPDSVLSRMDKLGFPAPDKEWMKELFNKNVSEPFSDEWISLILEYWNDMIKGREKSSLRILSKEVL